MVLVAVLGIYSRAEHAAAAITRKLDNSRLPYEVLQRIAEDLDRTIAHGSDMKITIENKFEKGLSTAQLTILKTIYGKRDKKQTFEKIVWRTSYDNDTDGLVLYRSHSGMGLEDKLLDEQKEGWEQELFVPICAGITFFKIQVPRGENFLDRWTSNSLPRGVVVTISFAEPFKTVAGTLDVPDKEKITRTIAIDRTRKIRFIFVKKEYEEDENKEEKDKESKDNEGEGAKNSKDKENGEENRSNER